MDIHEQLSALEEAAQNKHPSIRARAIELFGQIGSAADSKLPLVLKAAKDSASEVRKAAYCALPSFGPHADVFSTLLNGLDASDEELHCEVILALGRLRWHDPEILESVLNCVDRATKNVALLQRHAADALRVSGCLAASAEILSAFHDERVRVRLLLLAALTDRVRGERAMHSDISPEFVDVLEARLPLETDNVVLIELLLLIYEHQIELSPPTASAVLSRMRSTNETVRALAARIAQREYLSIPEDLVEQLAEDERTFRTRNEVLSL